MSLPSYLPAWTQHVVVSGRVAAGVVAALYALQLVAPGVRPVLALVPARVVPCVWQLVTAAALETSLVKSVISIVSLVLAAQVLEPVWGPREVATYAGVAGTAGTTATLVAAYVYYVGNVYGKDAGRVIGAHGVLAAALVALKQVTPDSEVTLLASIKFRVKQLPAAYVIAALVWAAATGTVIHTVPSVVGATLAGWLYLRLLQARPGVDFRGDPSPEFAFATLFPAPLVPAVERAVNAAARVTGLAARAPTVLGADVLGAPVLSEEAARRRERGARALEERLSGKAKAGAAPVDGEDAV